MVKSFKIKIGIFIVLYFASYSQEHLIHIRGSSIELFLLYIYIKI